MSRLAGLTVEAMRVVNTLETFASGSVAISDGVPINVAIALTSSTRYVVQRVPVKAIGAHFAVMTRISYEKMCHEKQVHGSDRIDLNVWSFFSSLPSPVQHFPLSLFLQLDSSTDDSSSIQTMRLHS